MTTEKETQKEINPFEYQYKPNDVVQIPANVILNVLYYCEEVLKSQPNMASLYAYPTDVKHKRDKEGNLLDVKIEWQPYLAGDMQAFFKNVDKAVPIATKLSVLSEQVYEAFNRYHMINIESGLAKKVGELTKEDGDNAIEEKLKGKK